MVAKLSEVVEEVVVVAAGVLESVGEDGKAVEGFLVVDTRGEDENCGGTPEGVEGDETEGVA